MLVFLVLDNTSCISSLLHVPNTKPSHNLKPFYNHDDTIIFECEYGYEFEGRRSEAQCVSGTWRLPVCKRKCPHSKRASYFWTILCYYKTKIFILQEVPTLVVLLLGFTTESSKKLTGVLSIMAIGLSMFVQKVISELETHITRVSMAGGPEKLSVVRFSHTATVLFCFGIIMFYTWLIYLIVLICSEVQTLNGNFMDKRKDKKRNCIKTI